MADRKIRGSEAYQWLDNHIVEAIETPDEAFDWVFMLQEGDWPLLEAVWNERPSKWREAFAYILHEGPVKDSQRLLRLALFDEDPIVAAEAAATLRHHQKIEETLGVFPLDVENRIHQILSLTNDGCVPS